MIFTAIVAVLLWLLRDCPVLFAFVLLISPSLILTHQFLEYERALGRHLTLSVMFAAWLMAFAVCVPVAPLVLGIILGLLWLVGVY
jgi:hypothetical protein